MLEWMIAHEKIAVGMIFIASLAVTAFLIVEDDLYGD